MQLDRPELFARLEGSHSVLIAGAGGGFDVLSGLPLWFSLRAAGKRVHLANLSFSDLRGQPPRLIHPGVVQVRADSPGSDEYFPERTLCRWFQSIGEDVSVSAFEATGVLPLADAYRALVAQENVDTIVLVDGGTDILMHGDEAGLGTPAHDIASLLAVASVPVDERFVVCLGFGVDAFHGVCHAHFLENVAALQREEGYLGMVSLLPQMPEVARYLDAVAFAELHTPKRPSIVHASIASAVAGQYGDIHRSARTRGSELWINPLMSTYFAFEHKAVAKRLLYSDLLADTTSFAEVIVRLEAYGRTRPRKPWKPIPV